MNGQVCPTAKMDKLLVATDGSDFSQLAVNEAIRLARICSGSLIAMSVVPMNLDIEDFVPQVYERAEKKALEHLGAIKAMAEKEGVECRTVLRSGEEPYQDIIDEAGKNHVDMIIMGTHGRTGLTRLMMGSVTAKVIGHAAGNVLVVPASAKTGCRNILIATDGSRYSDTAATEAVGIAKRCGGSLIVVSVAFADREIVLPEDDEEMLSANDNVKKILELAGREGVRAEGIVSQGREYEGIVRTAKHRNADLIVVGSHGRTGMERLLMGSVTERVIGHAGSAVLVVKT